MLEIINLAPTHLVGINTTTSRVEQGVPALWQRFRPQARNILVKTVGFFNVTIYPETLDFATFSPTTRYEAWAAVATSKDLKTPPGMAALRLEGGTYAKITYQGLARDFGTFAGRLYGQLIPEAGYAIDNNRPHFEFLPSAYRPDDPAATEDVYVPVLKVG